jgi:hypothetical protein
VRSLPSEERSTDVFEDVGGYAKPPPPPLPSADDLEDLERHGFVRLTRASRAVLRAALTASGYRRFHASLVPETVEALMRGTNMRQGRLFAPVYSATVVLADDPRAILPLQRAATLIVAASALCEDVMAGRLPKDELRGQPLEMGQYPNLFGTSVVVERGRARLFKTRHLDRIAVIVRRRIYTLDIAPARRGDVQAITAVLEDVVRDADGRAPVLDYEAPGILSAADGKTLMNAFRLLERSPVNAEALHALRSCAFVVCLDLEHAPSSAVETFQLAQAGNPANRWYLSSFQLVVSGNGATAGVFSFPAYLDGNVMMRAAAELQRRASILSVQRSARSSFRDEARLLEWKMPPTSVRRAWRDVLRVRHDEQVTFEMPGLGRQAFRSSGIDPVNAFVVALALATSRSANGRLPNILQLVSVSKYRCVPVGGAVVTTREVRRFVEHVKDSTSKHDRSTLLAEALASQVRECRAERSRLSLRWTLEAFARTRRGLSRVRAIGVLGAAGLALKAMGALTSERIIVSHPEIFGELQLVGRPGVRLPYVSHFGLHYQMFADKTVVTFMPGSRWKTPSSTLAREIERALKDILEIARALSPPG